jgi:hypothetical protein
LGDSQLQSGGMTRLSIRLVVQKASCAAEKRVIR